MDQNRQLHLLYIFLTITIVIQSMTHNLHYMLNANHPHIKPKLLVLIPPPTSPTVIDSTVTTY